MANVLQRSLAAAGALGLIALADPQPATAAIGSVLLAAGGLLALWTAAHVPRGDAALPPASGPFARVRHPSVLAVLLLGAGLVLFAASEGRRGRWVPRTLAPLGLLVLFVEVLPRADARQRAAVREDGGAASAQWLAEVPALVPRLASWPEADRRAGDWGAALRSRAVLEVLGSAGLAALCVLRARSEHAIGW